jgi:signal peptidase II
MKKKMTIIIIILVLIDQILKVLTTNYIKFGKSITIIPKFLSLIQAHNTGGAFSIFAGNTILLSLIGLFALIFIYLLLIKDKKLDLFNTILYSMLLAGIIGNLIDRIIRGYVIDYISIYIFNYNFPIFNFADICIVISIILIMIIEFMGDSNGKNNCC